MKTPVEVGCDGSTKRIEILSEDEEFCVGVIRNLVEFNRRKQIADSDLIRVEQALLAAGAHKLPEEDGGVLRRYAIRNARFALSASHYDHCKIDLRFELC